MWVVKYTRRQGQAGDAQKRLQQLRERSKLGKGEEIAERILQAVEADLGQREEVDEAVVKASLELAITEARTIARFTEPAEAVADFFEHEATRIKDFVEFASGTIKAILELLPEEDEEDGVLYIDLPLISLIRNAKALVQALVEDCVERSFDEGRLQLGAGLARGVVEKLCDKAGLTLDEAKQKPHKIKWPKDFDLTDVELVKAFLDLTPFGALLLTPVSVKISDRVRMEHCLITAGAGHGKTQTLQHMIASDLLRPKGSEVGIVVIDSQGDLISRLTQLEMFANNDRLLIVDASDVDYPVNLNIFNLGGASLKGLSLREREQIMNATVQLYEYVIGGLFGAEMTQKQSTVFRFLIRLMLAVPDATIHTLRECLEEPKDFVHVMEKLPTTARQFFANEFMDRQFSETRKQILRRLYGVLQNPAFERMFASSENKLDLYTALNAGRVVVCNTSREFLQNECSVFGRYCIAVTLKAAFDRARLPMEKRRTSYLYVDEASDYFDESVGQLLVQARKYKLGVVLAHQALDQMSDGLRALVMANTSMKLVGGASAKDARYLGPELRTSPEFILEQEKTNNGTRFATFVRNVTPSAVGWRLPFGTVESLPRMSEAQFEKMLMRNRAEIAPLQPDFGDAGDAEEELAFGDTDSSDDFSEPY